MLVLIAALGACAPNPPAEKPASAVVQSSPPPLYTLNENQTDQFLRSLSREPSELPQRVVAIARRNLGQPYDLYLLGEYPFESLDPDPIYNLRRSDCLTFCEHTYAMALAGDFDTFLRVLQRIRYKGGVISMLTRNHFTEADWNRNNAWLFEDLTATLAQESAAVPLHQICRRAAFFAKYNLGADIPDEIVQDSYIPTSRVESILPELRDGDFINIIRGSAESQWAGHTGLIARGPDGRVDFIHSARPQVRVEPLIHYLENDKKCVGIKVLRPRPEADRLARQAIAEPQATPVSLALLRAVPRHRLMVYDNIGDFDIATNDVAPLYESPIIQPEIPFNEAIVSWNFDVPEGSAADVELRVGRAADDLWSPYLHMGEWASPEAQSTSHDLIRLTECEQGKVDIDVFRSARHFDRLQYRVRGRHIAVSPTDSPARSTRLHIARVAVCVSDTIGPNAAAPASPGSPEASEPSAPLEPEAALAAAKSIQLDVPFRSQQTEPPEIAGRICCPASLAMVLQFRGCHRSTAEIARRTYDPLHDIYGNWPRAIQTAYTYGIPGYITRFNNWAEVEKTLSAGQPLIVTITAEPGELQNAPYNATEGHLLVITGFDLRGHVLANDPAAKTAEQGKATYSRTDLETVWLNRKQGTALVLEKGQ